jgi:transposase-like protein
MRRHHDATVKARVALEAIKGEKTIAQIAGEYGIHPNQIRMWRDRALAALPAAFSKSAVKSEKERYGVNHKRIERLMQVMGIAAIYPKRKTSQPQPENRIYPYLLDHLEISRPDQVWASDITYIRLAHGFVFLTAVMD